MTNKKKELYIIMLTLAYFQTIPSYQSNQINPNQTCTALTLEAIDTLIGETDLHAAIRTNNEQSFNKLIATEVDTKFKVLKWRNCFALRSNYWQ